MKRGSALVMSLWIIAVLSIMVLSFATEAHLQSGINVYVQERNRVNRLIEPGKIIGEIVLLGYQDVKEWEENEDEKELDEDDRWYKEKRALKFDTMCKIGPLLLDEEKPESGTVTVEIELANSGAENGININELFSGGDSSYALRWQMILRNAGIDEDLEVEVRDADGGSTKKHNLMNLLIASWNDWRDEDDTVSKGPLTENEPEEDDGAESAWYQECDETAEKEAHGRDEREAVKEDRRRPRNGRIPDIKELGYIRGFRDFPSVLTGGYLYDGTEWEKDKKSERGTEENPLLKGIAGIFGTSGSSKLVLNPSTTIDQILTLPGIFAEDEEDENAQEDAAELAQAILDTLKVMPEDYDVDETREWWPYKDWQDLTRRLEDNGCDVEIGKDAEQYIEWQVSETSVFKMTITGESMGMKRVVSCECYVNSKEKKVRYIKWRED